MQQSLLHLGGDVVPIGCGRNARNNLDAKITVKRLNQIDWHRVVIGPFKDPGSARTAKSKLNELNIPAIPLQQEN